MSVKVKSLPSAPPLLKNAATAPFIFFDNVPVYGALGGIIEIEIAARILMPKPDGAISADMSCTAHLRCNPMAAIMLIDALQKAIDMHNKQQEKPSELLAN